MSDASDLQTLLLTFIADEDAALAADRQGQFWPRNHGLISSAVHKAKTCLPTSKRERLYFHLLRLRQQPPDLPDGEYPHLVASYRMLAPFMDSRVAYLARRHILLFCFGFDNAGMLLGGETADATELKSYAKFIAHCLKYSHLPGQRAKIDKFKPFAPLGERLYQTLKHLGYHHDRRYGPEAYNATDLTFWGMVLTILLTKERRADLIKDMLEGDYDIPKRDDQLSILHACVEAVRAECQSDEQEFLSLANKLARSQQDKT